MPCESPVSRVCESWSGIKKVKFEGVKFTLYTPLVVDVSQSSPSLSMSMS